MRYHFSTLVRIWIHNNSITKHTQNNNNKKFLCYWTATVVFPFLSYVSSSLGLRKGNPRDNSSNLKHIIYHRHLFYHSSQFSKTFPFFCESRRGVCKLDLYLYMRKYRYDDEPTTTTRIGENISSFENN